jgi:transglutaminase-like putative cysteine protease
MRLTVRHTTVYEYDKPMRFVTQSHRLTPANSQAQTVSSWDVTASGAAFGASFIDGAGDLVATMTVEGPVQRVEIEVSGVVETQDTSGVLRGSRESISPRCYLRSTRATKSTLAFDDLLSQAFRGVRDAGDLARAHALSEFVSRNIAYRPGTTHAHSTAAEVIEAGEGVCQDHAHVLIALAHRAGMPARYVTGYLLVDSEGSNGEASHAWAEIHIHGLGWVGFDASNATCPDERYIRLGSGRDSIEAAPIRGVSRGGGAEAMDVAVKVSAQQ